MFDFHTHILPGMDDGSSTIEESLAMLSQLKLQGVDGLAATPHFYANRLSPPAFFEQRKLAWEKLKPHLPPERPEIRLGAEVQYFEGINQYDGLECFCIEGTDLLLLEMPHGVWTKRMLAALAELNERENMTVLLAHVERYYREQPKETWDCLQGCGIRMQASTSIFIHPCTRRMAMRLLRNGRIQLLGTDCHNMKSRNPNMADAVEIIRRKNGNELLQRMEQRERRLLQPAKTQEMSYSAEIEGGSF